jgi:uncharacterized protein (TIGR02996 family)
MFERTALLQAIVSNPLEQLPRLVYADWLDEYGTTDLDKATSQFIRISCKSGNKGVTMPRTAYKWLHKNWRRLIPSVMAVHTVVYLHQDEHEARWSADEDGAKLTELPELVGSQINHYVGVTMPLRHGGTRTYTCGFSALFKYGFLKSLRLGSEFARVKLLPLFLADQPILALTESAAASPAAGSTSSGSIQVQDLSLLSASSPPASPDAS